MSGMYVNQSSIEVRFYLLTGKLMDARVYIHDCYALIPRIGENIYVSGKKFRVTDIEHKLDDNDQTIIHATITVSTKFFG